MPVPWGYLLGVLFVAIATAAALSGPRMRPSYVRHLLGFIVNEVPTVGLVWLGAITVLAFINGDVDSVGGWAVVGLALVTAAGLLVLARRALRADDAVVRALDEGLGPDRVATARPPCLRCRLRLAGVLLAPIPLRPRAVERLSNISYGDAGERNLLDLYRRRSGASGGPTLVYLHGGSFRRGRKSREAQALLYRLAGRGWTCISATYRLSPAARFPDHAVDVKKVIAWVRTLGPDYGADPAVVVAGSSAGAHLAAIAALTPNDPKFQPGFEEADTSVAAALCLYGYYGGVAGASGPASSPASYVGPGAPPFFVAHGDADALVQVEHARAFVRRLRGASSAPVVYAELPGGQHGFDLFRTVRFEAVIDGIEAFASQVLSAGPPSPPVRDGRGDAAEDARRPPTRSGQ